MAWTVSVTLETWLKFGNSKNYLEGAKLEKTGLSHSMFQLAETLQSHWHRILPDLLHEIILNQDAKERIKDAKERIKVNYIKDLTLICASFFPVLNIHHKQHMG